jgi:hypothetical protein
MRLRFVVWILGLVVARNAVYGALSSCGTALTAYPVGNSPSRGCVANDLGFNNFEATGGFGPSGIVINFPSGDGRQQHDLADHEFLRQR